MRETTNINRMEGKIMKLKSLGANQTEVEIGDTLVLFSYNTPVAVRLPGVEGFRRTRKQWSVTTSKHINSWLRGFGLEPKEVGEIDQSFIDTLTA